MSNKREVYKERFPRTYEFDQRPPLCGELIGGTPAPIYAAGLVLYSSYIFGKYNNPRTWNSLSCFQTYLVERWKELGYSRDGFRQPNQLPYGINGGVLLSFATNRSNERMDNFLGKKEQIIDMTFHLLDLESESEQAEIRAKFKWYRGGIFDGEDDDDCD